MEPDQYFGDFDEEIRYSKKDGPRRWLGLFAGIVVGVVLGILSTDTFAELGFWIFLGVCTACVSWLTVFLFSVLGSSLCNRLGFRARELPRIFRFLGLVMAGIGLACLLALLFRSRGLGIAIALAPTIFFVCVYWTKAREQRFGLMSILLVGALCFVSSFRLFTVPALKKPPTAMERGDQGHERAEIIRVLTLNLRGSGFLEKDGIKDPKRLAQVVGNLDLDVVLLQGLSSEGFLSGLVTELGGEWSTNGPPEKFRSTAVLSKFEGQLESIVEPNYGVTLFGILRNNELIRFVSCEPVPGRSSRHRRQMVDWIMSECRKLDQSVVLAGNFYFNPNDRLNLISPMFTDSISVDRASWRSLGLLGNVVSYRHSDPLGTFSWKGRSNKEWIVVDPAIEIISTSVPGISLDEGNGLVLSLKPSVQEKSGTVQSPGVSY